MKNLRACQILFAALVISFSVNAFCDPYWEAFLNRPDKDEFATLENSIAARAQICSWGNPGNQDVAPSEKQNKRLFKLVGKGNELALRAMLLVSRCLDGGELEDFYRSVGNYFEAQPQLFLQIVKEKAIPDSQIRDFLIMLPLDTVDNLDRQIHIIENRIVLLTNVNENTLQEVKNSGLFFLEKELKSLNDARKTK